MAKGLEELPQNVRMSDYRDAMSRAAHMRRIARQENLSIMDSAFLDTEAGELFYAAQRYKDEILLFNSFVPWRDGKGESG